MDMILTRRPVNAPEALAIGLANRVVTVGMARIETKGLENEYRCGRVALAGAVVSARKFYGAGRDGTFEEFKKAKLLFEICDIQLPVTVAMFFASKEGLFLLSKGNGLQDAPISTAVSYKEQNCISFWSGHKRAPQSQ
jgi:hypothetical protein